MKSSLKSIQQQRTKEEPSPKKPTKDLPPIPKDKETKQLLIKKLPKNVNQYRHIIDTYYTRETDVEWMLELRHYNPSYNDKTPSGSVPYFYNEDLLNYKRKANLKDSRNLKTNLGTSYHLFDHPAGLPPNLSQITYETYLRTEGDENKKKKQLHPLPWNSTSFSPKANMFDTYLPPVLKISKDNLDKLDKMVSRPLVQTNTEGIVDGTKIRRRIFQLSPLQTLRYPNEHYPSSKYNNICKVKNINDIKHVMNNDNINATTQWGGLLRYYHQKDKDKNNSGSNSKSKDKASKPKMKTIKQ